MAENIVEGWLRSLNLVHYTQSFLDNGYDDLEVCKQIGELDLDAIGVGQKDHREKLLRGVRILKEEGGTAVYFTLEDTDKTDNGYYEENAVFAELGPAPDSPPILDTEAYEIGKSALLTYPRVQLKHILRDKLCEEDIDLSSPPYTTPELALCQSSLTALAVKYADELKTHFADVWDRLEELWRIARENDNFTSMCRSPVHSIYGGSSLYGFSPRSAPPPLPLCPPPNSSHIDKSTDLTRYPEVSRMRNDIYAQQNYIAVDGDVRGNVDTSGKKSSALGRFLRNIGLRRSGRKNSYKQHSGDPAASEITMSDEDRIALMVMVKEGKISTETALEVVKRFEEEKRFEEWKENTGPESPTQRKGGIGKKKKHVPGKPTKSQSAVYSDEQPRCHVCQHLMLNQDYEEPLPPPRYNGQTPLYECCRHRRVHSVGHIDFPHPLHSPQFVRAFSCSPTRNLSNHPLATNSPIAGQSPAHNRIYSPTLGQAPKFVTAQMQPVLPQGMDILRERLSGKPQIYLHKTSSRTSLLSSESDHSMECTSHVPLKAEVGTTRNDDMNYCSNSTVSMSSENSPAPGRKKCDASVKVRGHRWQRSASYSTGDDGISSENDDHEDSHLLGAAGRDSTRTNGGKLGVKLKDMKYELKKKVLKNKEDRPEGEDNEGYPRSAATTRPPLLRENCYGGLHPSGRIYGTSAVNEAQSAMISGGQVYAGPVLGRARVHTDYNPREKEDFLAIKKGEVITITSMPQSGVWRGVLNGKVGNFKFSHVDVIVDDTPVCQRKEKQLRRRNSRKSKPRSVEELMQRIGLEHLTSLFLLNGYEMLETFAEIDEDDLNTLNITDPEQRAKLLTAAELLVDCDSADASDGHVKSDRSGATSSDTPSSLSPATVTPSDIPTGRAGNSSRDSGCYASSEQLMLRDAQKTQGTLHAKIVGTGMTVQARGDNCGTPKGDNYGGHICNTCGKPRLKEQTSPKEHTDEGMETDRSDKEYTEEDKEVFAITNGYLKERTSSPPDKSGKNVKKLSVSYCKTCMHNTALHKHSPVHSSSCTQTTPKQSFTPNELQSPGAIFLESGSSPAAHLGETMHSSLYGLATTQPRRKAKPVPPPRVPIPDSVSPQLEQNYGTKRDAFTQIQNKRQPEISNISVYSKTKYPLPHPQVPTSLSFPENVPSASTFQEQDKRSYAEPIYGQKTIKNVSRSLIPLVSTKLGAEKIDLSEEPYSTLSGVCGIPPLLVQRYAEELRQDLNSVSLVLEQVRLYHLQNQQRICVPNENLIDSCSNACDLKISCIEDFLTSIGLPMYIDALYEKGCCTIELLLSVQEADLGQMTGADSRHLKRMVHAVEWVRQKLGSPARSPKSPKSPKSSKPSSVTDKV